MNDKYTAEYFSELLNDLCSACSMIGYATSGNERQNHRATKDKIKAEIIDAIAVLLRERESVKAGVPDDLDYVPGELDRTAPVRIWLQIDTVASSNDREEPWPGCDDITWQDESVGGLEIQYVRADLVVPMLASARALEAPAWPGYSQGEPPPKDWTRVDVNNLASARVPDETKDAQRYRLIRSGKSELPLPLGAEALDIYLDMKLKTAPKPEKE